MLTKGGTKEVSENVNTIITTLGKAEGYVLAASHNTLEDVPIKNILTLFDSVK